ncbi:MAG: hypothetical protein AAGF78_03440 [Pseudomonadota bacterium]
MSDCIPTFIASAILASGPVVRLLPAMDARPAAEAEARGHDPTWREAR